MKKNYIELLFILFIVVGLFGVRELHLENGHKKLCKTLQTEFIESLTDKELKSCFDVYKKSYTFKSWEKNMNSWLGQWGWSHLGVYPPVEVEEIWNSQTKNIGVKLKILSGEYLVYQAHPNSSFQKGDIILAVNGDISLDLEKVNKTGGLYRVERLGKVVDVKAKVEDFVWDDSFSFKSDVVKVPSFRGEFFQDDQIEVFKDKISKVLDQKKLIIDLRDNYGGNIASGLRFLSFFICDENRRVGRFVVPSKKGKGESSYPNSVIQSVQVEHMKNYEIVHLDILKSDKCFKGNLEVLVNSSTSSTAEMVAQALRELRSAKIVGIPTSGRMVLSSWERIDQFPEGYQFSYPYALFESAKGEEIEGAGITPDLYREYDLEKEKVGRDSFL